VRSPRRLSVEAWTKKRVAHTQQIFCCASIRQAFRTDCAIDDKIHRQRRLVEVVEDRDPQVAGAQPFDVPMLEVVRIGEDHARTEGDGGLTRGVRIREVCPRRRLRVEAEPSDKGADLEAAVHTKRALHTCASERFREGKTPSHVAESPQSATTGADQYAGAVMLRNN
jgi:hypothetical protein